MICMGQKTLYVLGLALAITLILVSGCVKESGDNEKNSWADENTLIDKSTLDLLPTEADLPGWKFGDVNDTVYYGHYGSGFDSGNLVRALHDETRSITLVKVSKWASIADTRNFFNIGNAKLIDADLPEVDVSELKAECLGFRDEIASMKLLIINCIKNNFVLELLSGESAQDDFFIVEKDVFRVGNVVVEKING